VNKAAVEVTIRGITQGGMLPFMMRCMACGEEWEPKPNRKGELNDAALDKSAADHWKACTDGAPD